MIEIDKEARATTGDGSHTLYHSGVGEHYHSKHGAVTESKHVFLNAGLLHFLKNSGATRAAIFEVGFGTGLNFLLTADYCAQQDITLHYVGVEAFPLDQEVLAGLAYGQYLQTGLWSEFLAKYKLALQEKVIFNSLCELEVLHAKILEAQPNQTFDVVYFDAFAAIHQPEMWSEAVLEKVASLLKQGGIFVTYAITGQLKRSLRDLGFRIEKLPGAPFKREMLRAIKL